MDAIEKKALIEAALRANGAALKHFVAVRTDAADVDDVLQIAAMRAVENAENLRDSERVLPWLYQIHRNAGIDLKRKQWREQRRTDALASEPVIGESQETSFCRCSLAQSRQLNSRYAAILEMVDIRGSSLKEAARILDVTVNTATVRLHRARAALRKRLRSHCGVNTMRDCADCKCSTEGCCPT